MGTQVAANLRQERVHGLGAIPRGTMPLVGSDIASLVRELKPRILEGLNPLELQAILAAASHRRFLANSVISHQGHPAEHLFLLIRGRARYFYVTPDGERMLLYWLPPGEMLGGAAILSKRIHYLVSTEAVKNSSALVWDRTTIRGLAAKYPKLLDNALTIAWDYLHSSLSHQLSLTRHTARQRLAHVLMNLASGIGHSVPGGVELVVSNEDLANTANVTPFTASRLLSEWQRRGMLSKSRGKVLLRHPERLLLHQV